MHHLTARLGVRRVLTLLLVLVDLFTLTAGCLAFTSVLWGTMPFAPWLVVIMPLALDIAVIAAQLATIEFRRLGRPTGWVWAISVAFAAVSSSIQGWHGLTTAGGGWVAALSFGLMPWLMIACTRILGSYMDAEASEEQTASDLRRAEEHERELARIAAEGEQLRRTQADDARRKRRSDSARRANGAPTGTAQANGAPTGTAQANGAPTGTAQANGAPTGTAQANGAPTGTAQANGAPTGTAQANGAPTGTAQANGAPTGTAQASGAPTGTAQASGAPTGTAHPSGAPTGTAHPSGAPTGTAHPSGAPNVRRSAPSTNARRGIDDERLARALQMSNEGMSVRAIARELNVSETTLRTRLREAEQSAA